MTNSKKSVCITYKNLFLRISKVVGAVLYTNNSEALTLKIKNKEKITRLHVGKMFVLIFSGIFFSFIC